MKRSAKTFAMAGLCSQARRGITVVVDESQTGEVEAILRHTEVKNPLVKNLLARKICKRLIRTRALKIEQSVYR